MNKMVLSKLPEKPKRKKSSPRKLLKKKLKPIKTQPAPLIVVDRASSALPDQASAQENEAKIHELRRTIEIQQIEKEAEEQRQKVMKRV